MGCPGGWCFGGTRSRAIAAVQGTNRQHADGRCRRAAVRLASCVVAGAMAHCAKITGLQRAVLLLVGRGAWLRLHSARSTLRRCALMCLLHLRYRGVRACSLKRARAALTDGLRVTAASCGSSTARASPLAPAVFRWYLAEADATHRETRRCGAAVPSAGRVGGHIGVAGSSSNHPHLGLVAFGLEGTATVHCKGGSQNRLWDAEQRCQRGLREVVVSVEEECFPTPPSMAQGTNRLLDDACGSLAGELGECTVRQRSGSTVSGRQC